MRPPIRSPLSVALAVSLATAVVATGASRTPHTAFAELVERSELVVLVTVHHAPGQGYTLDVEEVLKGEAVSQLWYPYLEIGSPIDDWSRAVIAFTDQATLDFRAPTIAWHVAADGTIDPERYQQYPGVPQTLDAMLTWFDAAPTQVAPSPVASPSPGPSGAIAVTIRAHADDPCPTESDCSALVSITPAGAVAPVVDGALDPAAEASDPASALMTTLAPGTYAVTVTALGLPEDSVLRDPPGQAPYPIGGCGATLELVAEEPTVTVTAEMRWYQPACGIVIEPRARAARSALADPVRPTRQPPRFRPRGAPDATATANGIRLELWVKDPTLDQGQWLLAHLRVTNVGRRAITYNGIIDDLRCPPFRFTADTSALFDPGQGWPGAAGEFKRRFMDQGLLQRTPLTIPKRDRGRGCGDVGHISRFVPGAVVDVPLAAFPAYELRAQPLPPGTIRVSAAFEGRAFGDPDRVSVSTQVTLAGEPVSYPSPGQLADVALLTPGFIEALEMAPDTDAWMNAWTTWWPKRPYPPQPRMAGATSAPRGILEIGQFVGSDLDRPFVVGTVIDPWTGESFGSSWF